jgi:hypothetical protein
MTCHNTITCVHEPFGEAWYFGPEHLSPRYTETEAEKMCHEAGHDNYTYRNVFDAMDARQAQEV